MSCSIHRFKFQGQGQGTSAKPSDTQAAQAMNARLQEMMAVRAAQDGGNFKARYEHPEAIQGLKTTPSAGTGAGGS